MTQIDQFESVFKAASRTLYRYEAVELKKVLVVSDLDAERAPAFSRRVADFLSGMEGHADVTWDEVAGDAFSSVGDLLQLVERAAPDLICTYRNLHSNAWRWPYTLGDHLEVLTQVANVPVLVVPRPDHDVFAAATRGTRGVMAITDHLTGDHRLLNYAIRFVAKGGRLLLAHVEDEAIFERYVDIISKLPTIDTDNARDAIKERLLKEPADYIRSCEQVLKEQGLPLRVEQTVTLGHRLEHYKALVQQHELDLLVLNTKDADQLAMHGLAYPLAVELRQLALLML